MTTGPLLSQPESQHQCNISLYNEGESNLALIICQAFTGPATLIAAWIAGPVNKEMSQYNERGCSACKTSVLMIHLF